MAGTGRTLRVSVLGVRVNEAQRYHVSVAAEKLTGYTAATDDAGLRPECTARTETAPLSINPEFLNNTFVLRLPQAMGLALQPRALLTVQLWAAAASLQAATGMQQGERLLGEAAATVSGEGASRLLRGERVTLTVPLTSRGDHVAAHRSQSRNVPSGAVHADKGSARPQVLLELTLLDAQVALPSRPHASDASPIPAAAGAECFVRVLVSRATGLPKVPVVGGDRRGELQAPSPFVALKSSRDAAHNGPVQSATRAVQSSCEPAWDEVLTMRVLESELINEGALLALVDDDSARVLCSTAVPLRHIRPGSHYSLRLSLPGGGALFVTLVLATAPATELEQMQARAAQLAAVLHVRLASCTAPLVPQAVGEAEGFRGIAARFEVADAAHARTHAAQGGSASGAAAAAARGRGGDKVAKEKGEPAAAEQLTRSRSNSSRASSSADSATSDERALEPSAAGSAIVADGANDGSPSGMPAARRSGGGTAAGGQDHDRQPTPMTLGAHVRAGAASGHVRSECYVSMSGSRAEIMQALEAHTRALSVQCGVTLPILGSQHGDQQLWPVMHAVPLAVDKDLANRGDLQLTLYAIKGAGLGDCLGTCSIALETLLQVADGSLNLRSDLQLFGGSVRGAVALEVRCWSTTAYLEKLRAECPAPLAIEEEWSAGPAEARYNNSAFASAALLDTLVHDVIAKQGALEHLQRSADMATARAEVALWRVKDTVGRNQALEANVAELRRMLHETRAGVASLEVEDLSGLSGDALRERARGAAVALRLERSKNAELVRRLKDMHAHGIDARKLTARMCELQLAHAQQNERVHALQADAEAAPTLKATVRKQERVIRTLEGLLKRTVAEMQRRGTKAAFQPEAAMPARAPSLKPAASLRAERAELGAGFEARLQQEVALRLAQEADARAAQDAALLSAQDRAAQAAAGNAAQAEELDALRKSEAAAVRSAAEAEAAAAAAAEQAEAAMETAHAAEAQLLEVTSSYAAQLAQLKARLMEKDAQLMGGFGNPVKLRDHDWSEPPFTPVGGSAADGAQEAPDFEQHPFGFEAFLRSLGPEGDAAAAPPKPEASGVLSERPAIPPSTRAPSFRSGIERRATFAQSVAPGSGSVAGATSQKLGDGSATYTEGSGTTRKSKSKAATSATATTADGSASTRSTKTGTTGSGTTGSGTTHTGSGESRGTGSSDAKTNATSAGGDSSAKSSGSGSAGGSGSGTRSGESGSSGSGSVRSSDDGSDNGSGADSDSSR